MNWDEKVRSWVVERGGGAQAIGPAAALKRGREAELTARWQRDQILSNEAVDRAAEAIWLDSIRRAKLPCAVYWADQTEGLKDDFRSVARAALKAAVGES